MGRAVRSLHSPQYARFRALLVDARLTAGVSQTELAARLGQPQPFVSKVERGERRVDLVEFLEIADALGIDPCRFIERLRGDGDSGRPPG